MNILVTGALGFIGHKVAMRFLEEGHNVYGWDRFESDGDIKTYCVDMVNEDTLNRSLSKITPDIIIHCAGSADVGRSVQDPTADYHGNVTIMHNLLFALHKQRMDETKVVFLSSASVYGNPISLPITEDSPLNPLSPYAVHKVMCEDLCKYFVKNYGMNIKIARIFSAYGAGLRKQIFWDMYQKYKNTGRLDMFGTGNESRDYIHINDVVQSLYLLATTASPNTIFNVANGEEVTIREATEMFAEACGINMGRISFNGAVREGDPLNWRADITKIKQLSFIKTIDMKTGLREYFDWAKRQNN